MLALDLSSARSIALVAVAVLVLGALAAAWVIRKVMSKLVTAAVLAILALLVWSQRTSLDDCASRVRATLQAGARDDTTCTFFGRDVTVAGRG